MSESASPASEPSSTAAASPIRAILAAVHEDAVELAVAHTDYRLRFRLGVDASRIGVATGKRIRGTAVARAMRFHPAAGGGRFVEPVVGEPRIVAGTVVTVDEAARRVLIDVALPIWIEPVDEQDWSIFEPGTLVTGYLHSGATFTPRDEDLTGG